MMLRKLSKKAEVNKKVNNVIFIINGFISTFSMDDNCPDFF